jgi:hypothetical protein
VKKRQVSGNQELREKGLLAVILTEFGHSFFGGCLWFLSLMIPGWIAEEEMRQQRLRR